MTTSLIVAAIAACLWAIRGIVRWYNLPDVAAVRASKWRTRQEEMTKRTAIVQKERTERAKIKRRWWSVRE